MDVYLYAADLWCEPCAARLRHELTFPPLADPADDTTWDSDYYPKGPYPDGGGPADSPQHCAAGAHCLQAITTQEHKLGVLLGNPLTQTGGAYVRDVIQRQAGVCWQIWAELYPELDP